MSVPALSFDHNPLVLKILLPPSFSEPRPVLEYMHANCPLFRSTLDQLIVTNPRFRERTDLEHTIQDFYSAVRQIIFPAIPQLTVRCHLLTPPSSLVNLMTRKKTITDGAIKDQDSACFISSTNFSPVFSIPDWINYEILNGHYTPKQNTFRKSPGNSRHLHDLFLGVQVFSSADTVLLLARHFERIHHINLNVGTTKHARTVNRKVNKYFRRPHPHVTEVQLTNPYETRRLIQSLETKAAPGTGGISATMLRNLSRKALIHLTQIFNHI